MTRLEVVCGAGGLLMIAFGAASHSFTGTLSGTLLFLPAGTLLCIGVASLQKDEAIRSPKTAAGLGLIVVCGIGAAVLAYATPEPFFGLLRGKDHARPFLMPDWDVLLGFHLAWTLIALAMTIGLRLVSRPSLERMLAIGLSLFAIYPTIVLICYLSSLR